MSTNIPVFISSLNTSNHIFTALEVGPISHFLAHLFFISSSLALHVFFSSLCFLYVHVGSLLIEVSVCTDLILLQHVRYVLRFSLQFIGPSPRSCESTFSPAVRELVRLLLNILPRLSGWLSFLSDGLLITHPVSQSGCALSLNFNLIRSSWFVFLYDSEWPTCVQMCVIWCEEIIQASHVYVLLVIRGCHHPLFLIHCSTWLFPSLSCPLSHLPSPHLSELSPSLLTFSPPSPPLMCLISRPSCSHDWVAW